MNFKLNKKKKKKKTEEKEDDYFVIVHHHFHLTDLSYVALGQSLLQPLQKTYKEKAILSDVKKQDYIKSIIYCHFKSSLTFLGFAYLVFSDYTLFEIV